MTAASTVTVAYTQTTTTNEFIKNNAGTATAADYTAAAVTNNIVPVVSSQVATAANTIEITYNAAIAGSAANAGKAQWQIVIDGGSAAAASAAAVSGSKVTLTTAAAMTAASTVTVAYTQTTTA